MTYDPRRIIETANSFLLAADRAFEQRSLGSNQFQMLVVPAVVSTAFAIELFFKGIITIEKGNATGHDLSKLFDCLSNQSQDALVARLKLDRTVFSIKLKAISNVFVEWRYIYESESASLDLDFIRKLSQESKHIAEGIVNHK